MELLEVNSKQKTVVCGLDFDVKESTGETVLVEWNNGFALGSYGLDRLRIRKCLLSDGRKSWYFFAEKSRKTALISHRNSGKISVWFQW